MDKAPITKEGLEKLRQELHTIITTDRPKNIKAIEEARSHGDLNENAEYHAAKERQSFLEAKISDLEMAISRSEVIEISSEPAENIIFGSTVELKNLANNKTVTYQLVGPYESNPEDGKISITSPLGKALIGKEEEDIVKLKTPGGIQEFEIVEIR
ncbi:MAG: transcription elongation factor GreA [Deltaproteobacteria bacterium]|nr:transcription elongation factor GreA [Deltaproteobacteria bacterium]MBW2106165.1 transcription elongation factor GreA [Deltaproteobacteria bacterium]MBW2333415.1 transcription elongation factor GreA [Deltaproteobacteria bacterium]RLB20396.1 MAG: transcription elongation factor GreA [Deltaproteobacteria bacterium]